MIQNTLRVLLVSIFLGWRAVASAPEILFEGRETLGFRLKDEEWKRISEKVYSFVTRRIPDRNSQDQIRVRFGNLEKYFGFTSKESKREIVISNSIRSHVEFQLNFAHELAHVIRHQSNLSEEYWLDEALAKYIEIQYANDWPTEYQLRIGLSNTFAIPSAPSEFEVGKSGYAYAFFLFHYLYSHLGGEAFLRELAQNQFSGWDAIESSAKSVRSSGQIAIPEKYLTREMLFTHFAQAMARNDKFVAKYALFFVDSRYSPTWRGDASKSAQSPNGAFSIQQTEPKALLDGEKVLPLAKKGFLLIQTPR